METGFSTIRPKAAAARVDPALSVVEWMSKTVFAAQLDRAIVDVVDIMADHRVRHVPIMDGERLVGIISDRDVRNALARKSGASEREIAVASPLLRRASEVMTRCPLTIPRDFSIHEAAEIMCREKIGALPVMDQDRMVGIISAEDLLWALMQITNEGRPSQG
jgi:acetoin utilization protein AcuB